MVHRDGVLHIVGVFTRLNRETTTKITNTESLLKITTSYEKQQICQITNKTHMRK